MTAPLWHNVMCSGRLDLACIPLHCDGIPVESDSFLSCLSRSCNAGWPAGFHLARTCYNLGDGDRWRIIAEHYAALAANFARVGYLCAVPDDMFKLVMACIVVYNRKPFRGGVVYKCGFSQFLQRELPNEIIVLSASADTEVVLGNNVYSATSIILKFANTPVSVAELRSGATYVEYTHMHQQQNCEKCIIVSDDLFAADHNTFCDEHAFMRGAYDHALRVINA